MSNEFQTRWAALATNRSVNSVARGEPGYWPAYDEVTQPHAAMDVPFRIGHHLFDTYCDFWDEQKE